MATGRQGSGRAGDDGGHRPLDLVVPHHRTRLRGRDGEIARALAELRGTHGRSVLVVGEAGSGKTALLGQLVHDLVADTEVLTVRGSAAIAGSDYASLGLLLSELSEAELTHPFLVVDGLTRLLRDRAHGRPVVIGVDNADSIDARSVVVLNELCARGVVRLILFTPDADLLDPVLQQLVYSGGLHRIDLTPLSLPDASLVLADELGGVLSRKASFTIWEAAAGNPRYLQMMRMSLLAEGRLVLQDGLWVLRDSSGPAERSRQRTLEGLHGMREEHRRVVDILACVRELPLPLLLDLAGHEVLDELLTLRLLLVDQRRAPAVRLRHPGLGDLVRAEMPLLRRRGLRDEVLAVVGDRALPVATRAGLIEWAVDAHETVPAGDALAAAEFALQTLDPARAAHLVETFPRAADDVHAVVITVDVLCASGEYDRAEHELARWQQLGLAVTDAEFVALAIAEQSVYRTLPGGYERAGAALIAARGRAAGDEGLVSRIVTAEVELAAHQGHYADIVGTHLPDGVEPCLPAAGTVLSADCVTRLGWIAEALAHVGRTTDAIRLITATRAALPPDGVSPRTWFAFTEHEFFIRILAADFARCRELVTVGLEDGDRPPGPIILLGELWEGLIDSFTGHHDRALDSLRPVIAQLAVDGRALVLPLALGAAAYNSARVGRTDETAEFLARLDAYRGNPEWLVRRYADYFRSATRLVLEEDRAAAIAVMLDQSRAEEEQGLLQLAFYLAVTATVTGDEEAARTTRRLAERVQGPAAALARDLTASMAGGDPAALLAAGETAEALELDALVIAVADRVLELDPLEPAHRRAVRGLLQRAQQRTATPASAARRLEMLTPMEQELAVGIADGASNEELGRRLHLSRRTVEWHLTNIYEKLPVTGRGELAAVVDRARSAS